MVLDANFKLFEIYIRLDDDDKKITCLKNNSTFYKYSSLCNTKENIQNLTYLYFKSFDNYLKIIQHFINYEKNQKHIYDALEIIDVIS